MSAYDLLVGLSLFVLIVYFGRRKPGLPLPPGPKRLPLIGNLLDMPAEFPWKTYHKWCKDLGSDIIHLDVAGTSFIILDTAEAAVDLLEKRSSIYSGRPRMPMVNELMGWDFGLAFMDYGDIWRRQRRLIYGALHHTAAMRFHPQEIKATHRLLRRLLEKPNEDLMENLRLLAGDTILSITYGLDVRSKDDPYIKVVEKAIRALFVAAVPGAFLVDVIPALMYVPEWMPFAGFKRRAKEWRQATMAMLEVPFEAAKQHISVGTMTPSFVSYSLAQADKKREFDIEETAIKAVAGMMYAGGSDTPWKTVSAIASSILSLLSYPEVLKEAQNEIDRVLGSGQLPSFEDQDSLPYVTATVKETLRWRDVAPLGGPHLIRVEDEYKGYRIPAGSIIFPNVWAMLHNEVVYPDPFEFKPERFMMGNQLNPATRDPAHATFGFGRRICPGRHMAFSATWIAVASLIAVFDITKAIDEDGKIIEPSHEYVSSLASMPLPFKCSIKPRSKQAADAIRATSDE